jgi:hypothetical protein
MKRIPAVSPLRISPMKVLCPYCRARSGYYCEIIKMDSLICTSRGSKLPSLMQLENAPSAAECFDRRSHDKSATFPAPPTPATAGIAVLLRSKLPKLQRATCDPRHDSIRQTPSPEIRLQPSLSHRYRKPCRLKRVQIRKASGNGLTLCLEEWFWLH